MLNDESSSKAVRKANIRMWYLDEFDVAQTYDTFITIHFDTNITGSVRITIREEQDAVTHAIQG